MADFLYLGHVFAMLELSESIFLWAELDFLSDLMAVTFNPTLPRLLCTAS